MVESSGAPDALTDEDFWDDQWWARDKASSLARFLRGKDHGADGRFIALFKAVVGGEIADKRVWRCLFTVSRRPRKRGSAGHGS